MKRTLHPKSFQRKDTIFMKHKSRCLNYITFLIKLHQQRKESKQSDKDAPKG